MATNRPAPPWPYCFMTGLQLNVFIKQFTPILSHLKLSQTAPNPHQIYYLKPILKLSFYPPMSSFTSYSNLKHSFHVTAILNLSFSS